MVNLARPDYIMCSNVLGVFVKINPFLVFVNIRQPSIRLRADILAYYVQECRKMNRMLLTCEGNKK